MGFSDPGLRNKIADHFTEQKEKAVAPFPGALEALAGLRKRVSRMGLVSNGGTEFQRRKLQRYDLERYFDAILIEGEFGVGKPDRRIFREALSRLGVAAGETWMVGDNLQMDVKGAQQAGIVAVWVDIYGSGVAQDAEVIPDRVIKHIADLLT
jgi:putative hydrolase of the HAD superfamily